VEIIPREIVDIVSKATEMPEGCRPINYTSGYKTLNDAIINAQNVGLCLLGKVKSENLLFVFCKSMESLQSALQLLCDNLSMSYPSENCNAPIYGEQSET